MPTPLPSALADTGNAQTTGQAKEIAAHYWTPARGQLMFECGVEAK